MQYVPVYQHAHAMASSAQQQRRHVIDALFKDKVDNSEFSGSGISSHVNAEGFGAIDRSLMHNTPRHLTVARCRASALISMMR